MQCSSNFLKHLLCTYYLTEKFVILKKYLLNQMNWTLGTWVQCFCLIMISAITIMSYVKDHSFEEEEKYRNFGAKSWFAVFLEVNHTQMNLSSQKLNSKCISFESNQCNLLSFCGIFPFFSVLKYYLCQKKENRFPSTHQD